MYQLSPGRLANAALNAGAAPGDVLWSIEGKLIFGLSLHEVCGVLCCAVLHQYASSRVHVCSSLILFVSVFCVVFVFGLDFFFL